MLSQIFSFGFVLLAADVATASAGAGAIIARATRCTNISRLHEKR
jgi:uncharacterized MnhB-related membrane protein